MIKINNTDISGVYVGSQSASSIYLGSTQIWTTGGGGGYDLPNVPYLCNYNAKDFDDTTQTFYRSKNNQLFQQDLTGFSDTLALTNNYVTFPDMSSYPDFAFSTENDNLFNRTSADTTFTAIYKTGIGSTATILQADLFSNRSNISVYNYMIRNNIFHTSDSNFLNFVASTRPATIVIRVDSQGNAERKCIETNQSATGVVAWGKQSLKVSFFSEKYGTNFTNRFQGDFYWMYISNNYLTDSQVQQVIDYNENK